MGNLNSNLNINNINLINFEFIINNYKKENYLLINTLSSINQNCLITNTLDIYQEEEEINKLIKNNNEINIIIYGKNCHDKSVLIKYKQLYKLGFKNIYIYCGGIFEWLLLQDIYGNEKFLTTSSEIDILKYR